jgi:hypothetical protein
MAVNNVAFIYLMNLYNICFLTATMQDFFGGLTQIAFNISPPRNLQDMFGIWMNQVRGKLKQQLLACTSTLRWVIWLSRNDVIFDKSPIKTFMQVL